MRKKTTTVEEQREARRLRLAKKKKTRFLKWLWIPVAIFLILLGINYLYEIEVLPIYPPAETAYYTSGNHCSGIYLKDQYYLTTADGIKTLDIRGRETNSELTASVSTFVKAMNEPVYEKSDNTVLVYDALGTSALLYNESGIITPFSFRGKISIARMNHKGDFVVIVNEEGSKAAVKVYDNYGNERYTWYSGTGYVVDAMINPDNDMMAVLTNDVSEDGITSKVLYFRMDSAEPIKGQIIGDHVAGSVSYRGGETFVLCTDGLYLLTDGGSLSRIVDVQGRELRLFDYFTDGSILLCFQSGSVDSYQCEIYDRSGKQTAQFGLNAFVRIGDIADDKFVVHTKREFYNVTNRGKIMKSAVMDYDIQNVTYFQNRIAVIGQDRMMLK